MYLRKHKINMAFHSKSHKYKSDLHFVLTILTVQSGFFAGLADYSAFASMIAAPYFINVADVRQIAAKDG